MQYMNNLRGFAILTIVFAHAISTLQERVEAMSLLSFVLGNGTILFVFIAGFLFAETSDSFDYRTFLVGKLKNVVVPYLIISIPAIALHVTGLKSHHSWIDMEWFSSLHPVLQILFMVFTGSHLGPLWFVPMICLYYLASPIFLAFLKTPGVWISVFLLALAAAYFIGRPPHNSNTLMSAVYYIPPYLMGMMLQRRQDVFKRLAPIAGRLMIGTVVALVAIYYLVRDDRSISDSKTLLLMLPTIVVLVGVFWARLNVKNRWLDMFARLSFFIYFVHGYFTGMYRNLLRRIYEAYMNYGLPVGTKPAVDMAQVLFVFATTLLFCLIAYVVVRLVLRSHSRYLAAT